MKNFKYVVFDETYPILIPESVPHTNIRVNDPISGCQIKATSAGFCYIDGARARCFGESISLKLKSNPKEDNALIEMRFLG